jgi:hypothetical protein
MVAAALAIAAKETQRSAKDAMRLTEILIVGSQDHAKITS